MQFSSSDFQKEVARLSAELDRADTELRKSIVAYAEKENAYRLAKAKTFLEAEGTVDAKKAKADLLTADERVAKNVAEGLKAANLELIRSLRAQLSAAQTLAHSARVEIQALDTVQPQWSHTHEPVELEEFIDDQPPVDEQNPF